jgi:outer membrane protein
MKKLGIALLLVVGFAGVSVAQTKIGHVKSQMLWDTLPSSEVANVQMEEFQKGLATEMQDLQANLQKLYLEYQELQQSASPSQVLLKLKEDKIREKETEFQKRQQSAQFEIQAFQSELEAPIIERIRKATEIVAQREKYDYVMDVNDAIYVNPANDITDKVAVELLKLEKEATASAQAPPKAGEQ